MKRTFFKWVQSKFNIFISLIFVSCPQQISQHETRLPTSISVGVQLKSGRINNYIQKTTYREHREITIMIDFTEEVRKIEEGSGGWVPSSRKRGPFTDTTCCDFAHIMDAFAVSADSALWTTPARTHSTFSVIVFGVGYNIMECEWGRVVRAGTVTRNRWPYDGHGVGK